MTETLKDQDVLKVSKWTVISYYPNKDLNKNWKNEMQPPDSGKKSAYYIQLCCHIQPGYYVGSILKRGC